MDKVKQSTKNVTAFGGLNFIYDAIRRSGIDTWLNAQMGSRSIFAHYSYADAVLSLFGNTLTQGSFVADLKVLKDKFIDQVFHKIPSPDTIEYICQELKQPNIVQQGPKNVVHELNYIERFNDLLVALAIKTKQLQEDKQGYVMDFDNVVIPTEKQDAKLSYKMVKGYHPNMAFIGRIPVHIENHNGNTPAKYQQAETLNRLFDNLDKHHIKIEHFRADSASYQKDVFDLVTKRAKYFYIRMMDFEDIRMQCGKITDWKKVKINHQDKEVASIDYSPAESERTYRIVVTRHKREDRQIDLLSGSAYTYQGIVTDNYEKSEQEVIEFYNQRGDSEKSNCYLLNDFNLHHLPFPDMDTNTVYMYLMAMCATMFEWTKTILVDNKVKGINIAMRTKAICFHYITVAATFINHAREKIITVFSEQPYAILRI
jgi:hypothetical protein